MLRPCRVKAPALVTGALATAFFGVSRTSGSGWATVLVACLLGGLLAGSFLPMWHLGRAHIRVTPPTDATVSLAMPMEVEGTVGILAEIPELATGLFRAESGNFTTHPTQRGVTTELTVRLQSSWPLGMIEWSRVQCLALPQPLVIGPFPAVMHPSEVTSSVSAGDQDFRGIRNYRPGDSIRSLHWPATARTGEMMVRETDGATVAPVIIVVDLTGPADAVEPTASRAAGLAIAALARGVPVVLATAEVSGPHTAAVTSTLDVSRRLAYAIAGPVRADLGQAP